MKRHLWLFNVFTVIYITSVTIAMVWNDHWLVLTFALPLVALNIRWAVTSYRFGHKEATK